MEKIPNEPVLSQEEQEWVEHFNLTVSRDDDGVYVVSLPVKKAAAELGNTRRMAMAQYLQLKRKFAREPDLRTLYMKYSNELLERDFMKICDRQPGDKVFYCLMYTSL